MPLPAVNPTHDYFGAVAILLGIVAAGAPWVKSMIDARIARLEKELDRYGQLVLELTRENAILRERINVLEKAAI
jgi:hypothetical protein